MALGINFGTGAVGDGDTLFAAFTKINNMFSTTTKLSNGDLTINDVRVGRGNGNQFGSTAIGIESSNSSSSISYDNTSVGYQTLKNNVNGAYNTAIGGYALSKTTSSNNTALGFATLQESTSGYENTAIGAGALQDNTIGYYNIAIGSGSQNSSTGTNGNTSVGNYSLYNANTGNQNTAIGYGALQNNSGGLNNTAIGYGALSSNTGFLNITGLGYNAQVTDSNQIQLGSGFTTCHTYGALVNRSDERDKTEIRDTVLGLDFINELRPVDYKWDMREDYKTEMPTPLGLDATEEEKDAHKVIMDEWLESVKMDNLTHDGTHIRTRYHHGLIAQEVQDVIQASGVDFGGFQDHSVNGGQDVMSIGYTELIAPMIKAIQELTARINVLEGN